MKIQCPICLKYYYNLTGKHLLKHGYKRVKDFRKDYPIAKVVSEEVSKKLSKHYKKVNHNQEKAKLTKLKKYKNGFGKTDWNKELTKEMDERVRMNSKSISKTWKNKSQKELENYGKEISKRLKGRDWENLMGIEEAQKRRKLYQTFTGEKSNFYKDGRSIDSIDNYGQNWKQIRKSIYKRDNWICQECKSKDKKVLCHHIKNYLDFPINKRGVEINCANNERNLITLCFSCHSKLCNTEILKVNTVRYMDIIKSKYLVTTMCP